jgi:uncharacterized repeat protein (TIGR01451 family)
MVQSVNIFTKALVALQAFTLFALMAVLAASFFATPARAQAPDAGTTIENTSSASYINGVTNTNETVMSNTVVATVNAVPSFILSGDQEVVRTPADTATFSYTITNTGNTTITVSPSLSAFTGDFFVNAITLGVDVNGDGAIQPVEELAAGDTLSLAQGTAVTVVVSGFVSELAQSQEQASATFSASSTDTGTTLTATATVTIETATVTLAKQVSTDEAFAGDELIYTLAIENPSGLAVDAASTFGGQPVTVDGAVQPVFLVRDAFPAQTTFSRFIDTLDFTPVYHIAGDDAYTFTTQEPAVLGNVDAIAFLLDEDFASGEYRELSFAVVVNAGAEGQSLLNEATVPLAQRDGTVLSVASNSVSTVISAPLGGGESITIFEDPGFTTIPPVISYDQPLYIEVASATCNSTNAVDTIQVVVETQPTGDRETYTATETGPQSGVFRLGPITVSEGQAVNVNDGVLNGSDDDTLSAHPQCDPDIVADVPVETVGFVFNSVTNEPVADVTVLLVDDADTVVASVTTDANGRYALAIPATGTYRIVVDNLNGYIAPSSVTDFNGFDRLVDTNGSYGLGFAAAGAGRVDFDIPVDPPTVSTLSLNKTADRSEVQHGRIVRYSIEVRNSGAATVQSVELRDELPPGFSYVEGSTTINGIQVGDPTGATTASLLFALSDLAPVSTSILTYSVRVGPNAGEGNRVNSVSGVGLLGAGVQLVSNTSRATVRVESRGSVFSTEGVILGKVFLDCNGDGIQSGDNEPGIPGVQLHTQQGITVVTDSEGRYSLPRLDAQTHVLDVYEASLPEGSEVLATRVMDAGNAGSRFVPLKTGEIRSEDFAVRGCTADVLAEVQERREAYIKREGGIDTAPLQLDAAERRGFSDVHEKSVDARYGTVEGASERTGAASGRGADLPLAAVQPHSYSYTPSVDSADAASTEAQYTDTQPVTLSDSLSLEGLTAPSLPTYEAYVGDRKLPCVYKIETARVKDNQFSRCIDQYSQGADVYLVEVMPVSSVDVTVTAYSNVPAEPVEVTPAAAPVVVAPASVAMADVPAKPAIVHTKKEYDTEYLSELAEEAKVKTPAATVEFENIQSYSNDVAFLDLEDGDVLGLSTVSVRIKGPSAGRLALFVNDEEVSRERIGQTVIDKSRGGAQLAEYVAVELKEGRNTLRVQNIDPFGNVRGASEISVMAAGEPVRLDILAPTKAAADPLVPFKVALRVLDRNDIEVATPVEVTLSASEGTWLTEDIRETEPGVQSYIANGRSFFEFKPSGLVGTHTLTVKSPFGKTQVPVQFLADYTQPPVFVGYIEGAYTFSESEETLEGLIEEDELSLFEETEEGVNGELFLKGKIRGDALLTMRYDSDKDEEARLFRDVQPDRFYPVYGDRSQIGFDAQSQGKLFVKVEKGLSYLLYGDVRYGAEASAFQLGGYQRTLEGAKAHFERGRLSVDLYAAETNATQQIVEIPGLGISGPYQLAFDNVVENSEVVEILTRDRDQPSVILSTERLARFTNYTLDYFDRSIIFTAPVQSFDANLNPVSIRVTFETVQGAGEDYAVFGGEAKLRVTDNVTAGYRELRSDAPDELAINGGEGERTVRAAYVEGTIAENTIVQLEVAQTSAVKDAGTGGATALEETSGEAVRLSVNQVGENHSLNARVGYTDEEFDAPGANQQAGTFEARVQGTLRTSDKTSVTAEGLYSDNTLRDETRYGAVARIERQFADQLSGRVGARYTSTEGVTDEDGESVDELVSAIVGVRWAPKFLNGANLDAEYEQEIADAEHFRFKLGADYAITPAVKAYLLSEWASTDRGAFAIGESARSNTSIRGGVEYRLTDNVKGFSEYRANQGSFDAGVANGLTVTAQPTESLQLRGRVEHVEALTEVYQGNTAAGIGATWEPEGGNSIVAGDIEYSLSQADRETWYANSTVGYRTDEVTFLARNRFAQTEEAEGDRVRDRLRVGAAYRPVNNDKLNALAWYEYGLEDTPSETERSHIWSLGGEYKPDGETRLRSRYAGQKYEFEAGAVAEDSLLHMAQIGLDRDITDRLNLGLNLSGFTDEDFNEWNAGVGVEASYRVLDNVLLGLGYNYATLEEDDFRDLYQDGFFIRVRMKFDENSWNIFRD